MSTRLSYANYPSERMSISEHGRSGLSGHLQFLSRFAIWIYSDRAQLYTRKRSFYSVISDALDWFGPNWYDRSVVKTRTVLRVLIGDVLVAVWVLPNDIEVVTGVFGSIIIAEFLDNVMQGVVFPADQDVSGALVRFDGILDTIWIISVTGVVDCDAEILSQWSYGIVGTLSGSVWSCQY